MKKLILIFLVFIFILSGCDPMTEIENQPRYEYEEVEAKIVELDIKHWFATTHRYQWNITVYYQPYDLKYTENDWANGTINAHSFLNKKTGDAIKVLIENTYVKNKIKEREIIEIY